MYIYHIYTTNIVKISKEKKELSSLNYDSEFSECELWGQGQFGDIFPAAGLMITFIPVKVARIPKYKLINCRTIKDRTVQDRRTKDNTRLNFSRANG